MPETSWAPADMGVPAALALLDSSGSRVARGDLDAADWPAVAVLAALDRGEVEGPAPSARAAAVADLQWALKWTRKARAARDVRGRAILRLNAANRLASARAHLAPPGQGAAPEQDEWS